MSVRLSASILTADFARLADEVARLESGGVDLLHLDVMDGRFVPNITFGPLVISALRRASRVPLDVHLMIADPDRYLEAFVGAGASVLTVHLETVTHLHRTLARIRELGAKAGVAINPSTPVSAVSEIAGDFDYLLVMSVNPGFSGQAFIPRSLEKVREARALLTHHGHDAWIGVDGGVGESNARSLVHAGASVLVAGAALFSTGDPAAATRALRAAAESSV